MANPMPWNVRGVDPDIREQALEAAERSGVSVGNWLNHVLSGNLDEEYDPSANRGRSRRAPSSSSRFETLSQRLERLGAGDTHTGADQSPVLDLIESAVQAIERLEMRQNGAGPASAGARRKSFSQDHAALSQEDMARVLKRLEARIDALQPDARMRKPASGADNAIEARLARLMAALDDAQARGADTPFAQRETSEEDPAFMQAIAEIEARRHDLDQGPAQRQPNTKRPVAPITRKKSDEQAQTGAVREQLDLLLSRVDDLRNVPRLDAGQLQSTLEQLTSRIEDLRAASNPDTGRLQATLEQLTNRIDTYHTAPRPDAAHLDARLQDITNQIEQWRSRPSEDSVLVRRDLAGLAAALETLSPQRLAAVVETAIANVVEKSGFAQQGGLPAHLLAPIEAMHQDISAHMQALANAQDAGRLAAEINMVAQKLDGISQGVPDDARIDEIMRETDAIKSLIGQAMHAQPLEPLAQGIDRLGQMIERYHATPLMIDDKAILEAVHHLHGQVETLDPAAGFAVLENRLSAISAIEERLSGLAGIEQKLDDIARNVGKLAREAQPFPQLESIASRLERIDRVLDNSKDQPLAGLDQLVQKLDGFSLSLDKITGASHNPEHEQLPGLLQALATRIDQALESGRDLPLAGLHHLAGKLDALGAMVEKISVEPAPAAQNDGLVALLNEVSSRLGRAGSAPAGSLALDALQDDITRLTRRMEETPDPAQALETLGKNIETLFMRLDEARVDIRNAAESAAEKAARDAISSLPQDDGSDMLAVEGLMLIKRDIGDVKSAQNDADRRTRQTLEALQATLEALVTRLATMETRGTMPMPPAAVPAACVQSRPVAEAPPLASPPEASPVMDAPSMAGPKPEMRPEHSAPAADRPVAEAPNPAPRPMQAPAQHPNDDVLDLPLEPGQKPGQPRPGTAQPPASNPMQGAPKPANPPMRNEPIVNDDPKANFIAAARRAAQAAAERNEAALSGEEQSKNGKKPDARNQANAQNQGRAQSQPRMQVQSQGFLARNRKPVLLGLGLLAFAVAATRFYVTHESGSEGFLSPAPARLQQSGGMETGGKTPSEAQGLPASQSDKAAPAPQQGGAGKRAQRLSEASILSQIDPVTVGSISRDGVSQPVDIGRDAINELIAQSNLKGQDRLRDAALTGNAAALFEVGARYADGRGMARDAQLAARWFEQAATAGHAPAQYRLASLYREGKGMTKDPVIAFQWFDRAAAQGHILAMHNAAVLLAEGVHGTPDYAGAALWFKRAAEHGVKDSQFNIAILYARGLGVNQDMAEAYRWFSAAAVQGDQDAAKKRDDIAARLSKDQLARERERLKTFATLKPNPHANDPGNWEAALPTRTVLTNPVPGTAKPPKAN